MIAVGHDGMFSPHVKARCASLKCGEERPVDCSSASVTSLASCIMIERPITILVNARMKSALALMTR